MNVKCYSRRVASFENVTGQDGRRQCPLELCAGRPDAGVDELQRHPVPPLTDASLKRPELTFPLDFSPVVGVVSGPWRDMVWLGDGLRRSRS